MLYAWDVYIFLLFIISEQKMYTTVNGAYTIIYIEQTNIEYFIFYL